MLEVECDDDVVYTLIYRQKDDKMHCFIQYLQETRLKKKLASRASKST